MKTKIIARSDVDTLQRDASADSDEVWSDKTFEFDTLSAMEGSPVRAACDAFLDRLVGLLTGGLSFSEALRELA